MANTDKDIVITPNKGQSADPVIAFSGANATVGAQTIYANVYPLSGGTISFEGSAGQLFSITNSLSGTIFSVNDVSGIPSISVDSSGLVLLAPYNGNVGIGTTSSTGMTSNIVSVYGSVNVHGNVNLRYNASGNVGLYFPDGTFQTTSATNRPSYGNAGTVQFAGTSNTFNGDSSTFVWDNANKRLGIGTATPANTLSVWGSNPGWFRTSNGADVYEVVIGNTTATSTTIGYAAAATTPYGYIAATAASVKNVTFNGDGKTGIGGTTLPKNTLDVAGAMVVGSTYAGIAAYSPPTNSLAVQGRVGVATSNPISVLDVNGIASFRSDISAAGTVTIASLSSNGTIYTGTAVIATAASHYWMATGSDNIIRPKTLANVQSEIVTTAAVNAAAATTVGTVTSGIWNAGAVTSATFTTTIADTATAASHYYVETASDGVIRPKTLANVQSEIVTSATVNAALSSASRKTANYTAVNNDRLICDTSAGTFTITLPSGPSLGTNIIIYDGADFNVNVLNIARNGSTIEGLADDFILDIGQTRNEILYDGTTWHIYTSIGPRGISGSNATTATSVAYAVALG